MKRYVSLAGAILVGTVVAREQKTAYKSVAEAKENQVMKKAILAAQDVAVAIQALECKSEGEKIVQSKAVAKKDIDDKSSVTSNVTSNNQTSPDTSRDNH